MSSSLTRDSAASINHTDQSDVALGVVTLRISGGRPIRFIAQLFAKASSWNEGSPAWHEMALYRCESGSCGVSITTCRSPAGDSDVCHAEIFTDLDAAIQWIQAFDPTSDLSADIDASDRRISCIDIALRASALRQRSDRVRLQYQSMVGELLYRMAIDD
jgi:hypothetical protein